MCYQVQSNHLLQSTHQCQKANIDSLQTPTNYLKNRRRLLTNCINFVKWQQIDHKMSIEYVWNMCRHPIEANFNTKSDVLMAIAHRHLVMNDFKCIGSGNTDSMAISLLKIFIRIKPFKWKMRKLRSNQRNILFKYWRSCPTIWNLNRKEYSLQYDHLGHTYCLEAKHTDGNMTFEMGVIIIHSFFR